MFLLPVFGRGASIHARRACSSFMQPSAVKPEEAQQPVREKRLVRELGKVGFGDGGVVMKGMG